MRRKGSQPKGLMISRGVLEGQNLACGKVPEAAARLDRRFLDTPLHLIGKGVQLLTSVKIWLLGSPMAYHSLQGATPIDLHLVRS